MLGDGEYDFAVSRAYYAMFYAAQAALLTRGVRRSKHSGVLAAFNREFVRGGVLPRELFAWLRDGLEDRIEGDYGLAPILEEQGSHAVATAHQLVSRVRSLLALRRDADS